MPLTRRDEGVFELSRSPASRPACGISTAWTASVTGPIPSPASSRRACTAPRSSSMPQRFPWTDQGFRGHALADLVFYELHVGHLHRRRHVRGRHPAPAARWWTSASPRIELMPVAEFPGSRNWGYDGVHLYAPQSTYGGPRGPAPPGRRLPRATGCRVVLDVVYNHLGPEGNYLAEFGPYFTDRYQTPWGSAVNFDGPDAAGVRRHFIDNARYWVREFHLDGLRLDAIHSIFDASPVHILTEVAEAAREEAPASRPARPHRRRVPRQRPSHRAAARPQGGLGLDAVWADDFHHAVHAPAHRRARRLLLRLRRRPRPRPRAGRGLCLPGRALRVLRPRAGHPQRRPARRALRRLRAEPRPGRQSRPGRPARRRSCPSRRRSWPPPCCSRPRPCRCCSWARSTARPRPSSSSPRSSIPRWRGGAPRPGTQSSPASAGRARSPTPSEPATFLRSRLSHPLAGAPRHRELRDYYRQWLSLRRSHPALGARRQGAHAVRGRRQGQRAHAEPTGARRRPACGWSRTSRRTAHPFAPPPEDWRVLLDSEDKHFAGAGTPRPLAPYQRSLRARSIAATSRAEPRCRASGAGASVLLPAPS